MRPKSVTLDPALVEARLVALMAQLGRPQPDACCAGAAGSEFPAGKRLLEDLLARLLPSTRVLVVHDTRLVLAASGLLDGRRATTHWRHVGKLAERYPAICVEPDVLYVDEGQVLTSAGTAAGIDLCLHIVRQ